MQIEPLSRFLIGVLKRWYVSIPTILLDPFDFYERYKLTSWPSYTPPAWAAWLLLFLAVLLACYMTYNDLWNDTPERHRRNPGYMSFDEAAKFALRTYVKSATLSQWHNARFSQWQWIGIHLEEAVKEGELPLFEELQGGRILKIPYETAHERCGQDESFFNKPELRVHRKDIKPAWRYVERKFNGKT